MTGKVLAFPVRTSRPCGVCGRELPYEDGEEGYLDALCPACVVWSIHQAILIGGVDCASILIHTNGDLKDVVQ